MYYNKLSILFDLVEFKKKGNDIENICTIHVHERHLRYKNSLTMDTVKWLMVANHWIAKKNPLNIKNKSDGIDCFPVGQMTRKGQLPLVHVYKYITLEYVLCISFSDVACLFLSNEKPKIVLRSKYCFEVVL